MIEALLTTRKGEPVAYVVVPVMEPPPDVLVWGDRVFKRGYSHDERGRPRYVEMTAYWVPLTAEVE